MATSFHGFADPKFPVEIRRMIINAAMQQGQTIKVRVLRRNNSNFEPKTTHIIAYYGGYPALLRTCRLSRDEAKTFYDLCFQNMLRHPIYFNKSVDLIECDNFSPCMIHNQTPGDWREIQRLAVTVERGRDVMDQYFLKTIPDSLPHLRQFILKSKLRSCGRRIVDLTGDEPVETGENDEFYKQIVADIIVKQEQKGVLEAHEIVKYYTGEQWEEWKAMNW